MGYVLRQAAAAPWGAVRQRLQLIPPPEVLPDCLGQDVGGVRPLNGAALIHQDERGAHPAQCAWWACAMVPAPSGPWCMGGLCSRAPLCSGALTNQPMAYRQDTDTALPQNDRTTLLSERPPALLPQGVPRGGVGALPRS